MHCPYCKANNKNSASFCANCGKSLLSQNNLENTEVNKTDVNIPNFNIKSKSTKKKKLFIVIAAMVIAAILIAIAANVTNGSLSLGGNNSNSKFGFYIKNQELFGTDFTGSENVQQISQTISGYFSESRAREIGSSISEYCHIGKNGTFFYVDDMRSSDDGIRLYYRNLNKPEKEPVYIDEDIVSYVVSEDSDIVLYLQDGGGLYLYNIKSETKEKIGSSVENYEMSPDGKKLVFINEDGGIFFKQTNKDAEIMAEYASNLAYVTKDISAIYYEKGYSLYKFNIGADEPELIAEDINEVIKVYETGEIYYTKDNAITSSAWDFITDDMKEADDKIVRPEYPDIEYPSIFSPSYKTEKKEYDRVMSVYEAAKDLYDEKANRDKYRAEFTDMYVRDFDAFYYYDGSEEILVSPALSSTPTVSQISPVAIFSEYSFSKKIPFSDFLSIYRYQLDFDDVLRKLEDYYCVSSNASVLDMADKVSISMNPSGTAVLYSEKNESSSDYDLYRLPVLNGDFGEAEVYSENTSGLQSKFLADDIITYVNDTELYVNKELIASDASRYYMAYNEETNQLLYYTNWDSNDNYGTLNVYKNGQSTKISEFVSEFYVLSNGNIMYLYDCNQYHNGSVRIFENGQSTEIDTDVSGLVSPYSIRYKGEVFGFNYYD